MEYDSKKLRLSPKLPKKPNFLKHVFLQKLNDLEHLKFFFVLQKKISNVLNRSIFAKKHVSKNWVFWAILEESLSFFGAFFISSTGI